MTFTAETDVELWLVTNADYTAPMYCVFGHYVDRVCWYLAPAINLPQEVWVFMQTRMNQIAFKRKHNQWLVTNEMLEANLVKARGITPSHYVRSNGKPVPKDPTPVDESRSIDAQFVDFTCRKKGLVDRASAQRHWWAFCEAAIDWLIDENKPINMGLCKLHAFPYRLNWQSIIAAKFPGLKRILDQPDEAKSVALTAMSFDDHLYSANMVGYMPNEQTFTWTLHVQAEKPWTKYTNEYESSAFLENTPETYASRWAVLVKKVRGAILGCLESWFGHVALPNAVVDQRAPYGYRRFLVANQGRIRPSAPPLPVARAVYPEGEATPAPTADSAYDFEVADMPELPDEKLDLELMR